MAKNFNILNHRPAKFGMGNDYGLLYGVTYVLIISDDCFWQSVAIFGNFFRLR